MPEESLSSVIGELRGLMNAAAQERLNLNNKITTLESTIGKVDVVIAELAHMRADYHERFGNIQRAYGEFLADIKAHEKRISEIETGEKVDKASASQKKALTDTMVGSIWTIIVSAVGGIATLIVQYVIKK